MKYLLQRLTALLLAALLLCSVAGELALAAPGQPDPACVLGAVPSDMLAGGGRRVQAGDRQLYIDDVDGSVYELTKPRKLVLEGPVAKLNYADGVLYYAREQEESRFDLCAYDLEAKEETVLLAGFSGKIGQLWLVNGTVLDFSCGNAVWELELETGAYRLALYADQLWSFVPTGCGLIYATGSLFDYTVYAGDQLLAEHVSDYTVRFDLGGGLLVYTAGDAELQADLSAAFAGTAVPMAFTGEKNGYTTLSAEEPSPEEEMLAQAAEAARIREELEGLDEPQDSDGNDDPAEPDPQHPADPEPTEPEPAEPEPTEPEPTEPEPAEPEPTEPEPTEPEPTEPEPAKPEPAEPEPTEPEPTEPEPTDPAPTEPEPTEPEPTEPAGSDDPVGPRPANPEPSNPGPAGPGSADTPIPADDTPPVPTAAFSGNVIRPPLTSGQQNIVKRARQMLNIKWTAQQFLPGWGYYDSSYTDKNGRIYIYSSAGEECTGIPYAWPYGHFVPWNDSLSAFAAAAKDPNSKLYTERSSGGRGSTYYGVECAGFVTWAWQTPNRMTCTNLAKWSGSNCIGNNVYDVEIGDAFIKSGSHAVLVTDLTYNADGTYYSIEIAQANPTTAHDGCCYAKRYTGTASVLQAANSYLNGGYKIYRNLNIGSVTYTHDCAVPLEGDVCDKCGCGGGESGGEVIPDPVSDVNRGVDLSVWNGDVDWMLLSTQVDFAILRIGYTGNGSNFAYAEDAKFDANIAGCKAYNVPYAVYWYGGATNSQQAIQEAEAVIEYLGVMNGSGNIPSYVFYDVEEQNNLLKLTDTELRTVITEFCSTLETFGIRAGVYASRNIWATRLTSGVYGQWARWVSQWDNSKMTAPAGGHVWQYSSTGAVQGVKGDVDLDYWLGDVGSKEHACAAAVTADPTCVDLGTLRCTAVDTGSVRDFSLPDLGHSYKDGVCTRCGVAQDVFERFTDVLRGKFYSDALVWAVENGVTAGTTANTFSPNRTCTREQVMTFLWKAMGSPEPSLEENPFTDVPAEKYYCKPILWACQKGVTSGVSPTVFGVGMGCTRAQVVTFLYAAAGKPELTDLENPFEDVQETDYYYEAVLWAYQNGITSGITATTFGPKKTCTRAQIVTFLYAAQKNR